MIAASGGRRMSRWCGEVKTVVRRRRAGRIRGDGTGLSCEAPCWRDVFGEAAMARDRERYRHICAYAGRR